MKNAQVQFDCPYCGKEITVPAELLGPDVKIKCGGCEELIPAGVFYDAPNPS